jgi:hypothetical protein
MGPREPEGLESGILGHERRLAMMRTWWTRLGLAAILALCVEAAGIMGASGVQVAKADKQEKELPSIVAQAFKATFPKGEIEKLDVEVENGVTVYDIEFKNGTLVQETDIAADGTILEITLVVDAKAVPSAAMKAITKAAEGGKIGRIEKIDISYETRDGKAVKLPQPMTHYAAEIRKGDKTSEVVFTSGGTRVKE